MSDHEARPWYETAFGLDYLERYAHRDSSEAHLAIASLVEPLGLVRTSRVLDLACGPGRHSLPLAERYPATVSFDLSAPLLAAARGTLEAAGHRPACVRGDMRQLPFGAESFQLVVNFFTAFGYFDPDEENLAVFAEVRRVLAHGGWFLFDFLNEAVVRRSIEPVDFLPERGAVVRTTRRVTPPPERIEKRVERLVDGRAELLSEESVRFFRPEELRLGLRAARFDIAAEFGGYGGGAFDPGASARWIALARARP
ncbi:MAG: methyltransferase domain-containing protein [Candidatus Sumerlaeia bacterium]|nr:methyltransferase domain-containing protein [Candidatus Sumerlaeia bacterium]